MIVLSPSILSADFSNLGEQINIIEKAGVEMIHLDIMDGHFVPNITFGPFLVKTVRKLTKLPLDCHLMIEEPEKYVDAFVDAGADSVTIHVETAPHLHRRIEEIHKLGKKAGVALNPSTPLSLVEEILSDLDLLLVMSVNPGFSGQKYIPASTDKIRRAREMIDASGCKTLLQVDGGIGLDPDTLTGVVKAGVDIVVSASAIFKAPDIGKRIQDFRKVAALAQGEPSGIR